MSSEMNQELEQFATLLRELQPVASELDREDLLFQMGREAGRMERGRQFRKERVVAWGTAVIASLIAVGAWQPHPGENARPLASQVIPARPEPSAAKLSAADRRTPASLAPLNLSLPVLGVVVSPREGEPRGQEWPRRTLTVFDWRNRVLQGEDNPFNAMPGEAEATASSAEAPQASLSIAGFRQKLQSEEAKTGASSSGWLEILGLGGDRS